MATGTLEADDSLAAFAEMDESQRSAYVDSLHTDLAAEKAGSIAAGLGDDSPPAPEAGKTRDEAGRYTKQAATTETPASGDETPATDDAASQTPKGSKSEEAEDWRNAETKDLATQYGLDEEALAAIPSRDVLDTVLKAIDRKAFEAGKTAPAKPQSGQPAPEAANAQQQTADDALARLEAFSLDDELGADDAPKIRDAVKAITAELKEMRQFRGTMQQQQGQAAFAQLQRDFTASVDSLGHTELFGKPGERTAAQAANLEKAFHEGHIPHARGLLAQGRQVAPTPAFAKAAVNLLFGDQLVEHAKQQQLARIKKQSARITGGGSTKVLPLPEDATPLERNLREATENWRRSHGEDV
jgi:hypothetical protein